MIHGNSWSQELETNRIGYGGGAECADKKINKATKVSKREGEGWVGSEAKLMWLKVWFDGFGKSLLKETSIDLIGGIGTRDGFVRGRIFDAFDLCFKSIHKSYSNIH